VTQQQLDMGRSEDWPFHAAALACVTTCAEGRAAWALPWPCVHEFFAIVTHPRIYNPPTPTDVALAQIDAWLESPSLVLLTESERHGSTLQAAARDFRRSPQLKTRHPLVSG
jgi:predicted nucleic acid-binding protein